VSAFGRFVTVMVGAAAVGLMGVLLGAWWAPFPVGLAAGILVPKARWAMLAGAVAGLVAWGVPLEYSALQFGLARTSLSLAAIMGFNGAATIPIALTLLLGALLGFCGSWLGSAALAVYRAQQAPAVSAKPLPGSGDSARSGPPRTAPTPARRQER
jgi:hypothetical protein